MEATIKTLATKDDIASVRKEIVEATADIRKEVGEVKADFRKEAGELKAKISEARADNIKWMFLFWIGQVGTTLGIIFLFFKK